MGTVRIDPPAPSAPSEKPTTAPNPSARATNDTSSMDRFSVDDGQAGACPGVHAAGHVEDTPIAEPEELALGRTRPVAATADQQHVTTLRDFRESCRDGPERDEHRVGRVALPPFLGLADIDQERAGGLQAGCLAYVDHARGSARRG